MSWKPASERDGGLSAARVRVRRHRHRHQDRNYAFRATLITAYLRNDGILENAAAMAKHAST